MPQKENFLLVKINEIKPRHAINIFGKICTVTLSRRILGSLSKVVFEKRLSTGCEASSQGASSLFYALNLPYLYC